MPMLDSLPLPDVSNEQIHAFTKASLHAVKQEERKRLAPSAYVLGVDIGGSKLDAQLYRREGDSLIEDKLVVHHSSPGGVGFGPALSALVPMLPEDTAVGIAVAGTVEDNQPVQLPNLPDFMQELALTSLESIVADHQLVVVNDAQAGLMASCDHILRDHPEIKHVLFVINGSGLGGSAWIEGNAYALEPGHVPVSDALNPFKRDSACGMFDQSFTCLEQVTGGVAGIQATWDEQRHHEQPVTALEGLLSGDTVAQTIYDASVIAAAHVPVGIAHAYGITDWTDVAVVCHGGVFGAPGYFERYCRIVSHFAGDAVLCIQSDAANPNVCLYGAALSCD